MGKADRSHEEEMRRPYLGICEIRVVVFIVRFYHLMEMLIIFRLESESHYLQHMNHKTFDSSFPKLIKFYLAYAFYF